MKPSHRKTHSLILTIASIIAACMVIAVALFAAMGNYFVNEFRSYVLDNEMTETEVAINLFDNDIDTLMTMMYSALLDAENTSIRLRYANGELNSGYRSSVEKMQAILATMENVLDFANDVTIYFVSPQLSIASSTAGGYGDATAAWVEEQLRRGSPSIVPDGNRLVVSIGAISGLGKYPTDSIITSNISMLTLERYLEQFAPDADRAQYILFIREGENLKPFASAGGPVAEAELMPFEAPAIAADGLTQVLETAEGSVLATWKESEHGPVLICQITPLSMLEDQVDVYRAIVVLICIAFAALIGLVGSALFFMIKRPLDRIQGTIAKVERGDFSARVAPTWSTEFQATFDHFNKMTARIRQLIAQEYELRLLNARAEIKQLQCQINPHFLYNSYFILRAMLTDEDYESAQEMADILGQYMRYITNPDAGFAALSDEARHSAQYMRIQQIRFGDRIEIRDEPCPEALRDLRVPRLILQPLIENAFEHGLKQKTENGIVWLHYRYEGDALSILVEDNGSATEETISCVQAMLANESAASACEGVALCNIARRLRMIYGEDGALSVSRSALGGFCAQIRIGGIVANGEQGADRR